MEEGQGGNLGWAKLFGGKVGLVDGSKAFARKGRVGSANWLGREYVYGKIKQIQEGGGWGSTTRCAIHRRLPLPPSFYSCKIRLDFKVSVG